MTEPGANSTTTPEPADTAAKTQPTNNEVKNHPLFLSLTAQLAERNEADEAAKAAAEEKAKADELAKLEADGKYEEATKFHATELEKVKVSHAKELLNMSLKAELAKAGFTNEQFLAGSIAIYDIEKSGTPSEYAAKLATDDANKAFLAANNGRQPVPPAGKPNITGAISTDISVEQIRELQLTDDKGGNVEDRRKVVKYLEDYMVKNGKMPEGL